MKTTNEFLNTVLEFGLSTTIFKNYYGKAVRIDDYSKDAAITFSADDDGVTLNAWSSDDDYLGEYYETGKDADVRFGNIEQLLDVIYPEQVLKLLDK